MYAAGMPKMLQVRNLPDDVHERLVARAAQAGMSLSEYVGRQLRVLAERPTLEELALRAEDRSSTLSLAEAAELVRADRDSRS